MPRPSEKDVENHIKRISVLIVAAEKGRRTHQAPPEAAVADLLGAVAVLAVMSEPDCSIEAAIHEVIPHATRMAKEIRPDVERIIAPFLRDLDATRPSTPPSKGADQ